MNFLLKKNYKITIHLFDEWAESTPTNFAPLYSIHRIS